MAAQSTQPAEETLHYLTRLSQKPGVQSTLILSRDTGAIVRTSGLLVSATHSNTADGDEDARPNGSADVEQAKEGEGDGKLRSADEVARAVWAFFGAAGGMVDELCGEAQDEVKLIRLRMKRCELMVVPDPRFLLVAIHDTPPA